MRRAVPILAIAALAAAPALAADPPAVFAKRMLRAGALVTAADVEGSRDCAVAEKEQIDRGTWLALIAMGIAVFVVANDFSAINVVIPSIEQDFDTTVDTTQWVVNAYALTFGVLIVTGGRLADLQRADVGAQAGSRAPHLCHAARDHDRSSVTGAARRGRAAHAASTSTAGPSSRSAMATTTT